MPLLYLHDSKSKWNAVDHMINSNHGIISADMNGFMMIYSLKVYDHPPPNQVIEKIELQDGQTVTPAAGVTPRSTAAIWWPSMKKLIMTKRQRVLENRDSMRLKLLLDHYVTVACKGITDQASSNFLASVKEPTWKDLTLNCVNRAISEPLNFTPPLSKHGSQFPILGN